MSARCVVHFLLLYACLAAPCLALAFNDVVVDNDAGAPGYTETGQWSAGSSAGYQGGTYRYTAAVSGAPTRSATWRPNLPSRRLYHVYAAFLQGTNRTTSAPLTITHTTGTTVIHLNQAGATQVVERFLGEFLFDAGTAGCARMDNNGSNGVHIADTMIWRIPSDPLPAFSSVIRTPEFPTHADPIVVTATITDNTAVTSAVLCYTLGSSSAYQTVPATSGANHAYSATIPAQPDGSIVGYSFMAADDLGQLSTSPIRYCAIGPLLPGIPDIVADNDNGPPTYVETGHWTTGTAAGYKGGTYRYTAAASGAPTSRATWTVQLPRRGVYRLYAALQRGTNRTTSAPLTVFHALGQATTSLDQYGSEFNEVLIGEYPFDAATSAVARMENNAPPGVLIADAMIWRMPSDAPPSIARVSRTPLVPTLTDSVVVTATITDNIAITSAALCYTANPPGMQQTLQAYDDGMHGDGAPGDHVYGATIPAQSAGCAVNLHYRAWDNLGQLVVSPSQYYVSGVQPKNVYVVLSSDTSVWGVTGGYHGLVNWNVFESRTGVLAQLYDEVFRNSITDSQGRPFKLSWFMHGGAWFASAVNSTHISALYHIRKNWGEGIARYGDALEYHFHHYVWDGSDWAMAPTFTQTIPEYEWAMSQMMLDERLFIAAFRSGWNYMDDPYQQYLERWVPFRMEGVQTNWLPYHPSTSDWKVSGTMKGWEARHIYMKSFTAAVANQVFSAANQGGDRIACIWSHQNEADYPQQVADVDRALHTAAANYPSVQFHYCSAREAMQKWLNHTPSGAPSLEVVPVITGDNVSVTIRTQDDIYQEQPWVAARRYTGVYARLDTTKTSSGIWQFSYSRHEYDHVAVGVSDIYGNDAITEVDDGSRRWAVQSEFAGAKPFQVDIDTSPTCVKLAKSAGVYVSSGTLTFDHSIASGGEWRSVTVSGATPEGTNLRWRYKSAASQALLDSAPWSAYQTDQAYSFPAEMKRPWLRVETALEGTSSVTPELNSVEVKYEKPLANVKHEEWKRY